MRSREEYKKLIIDDTKEDLKKFRAATPNEVAAFNFALSSALLDVLIDIRDLLEKATQPQMPQPVYGMRDEEPPKKDELFDEVKTWAQQPALRGIYLSAKVLAARFDISPSRASSLIADLEAAGVITAPDKNGRRKVV